MKEKKKPEYNLWQNIGFMVKMVWHARKSVVFVCLIIALLSVVVLLPAISR